MSAVLRPGGLVFITTPNFDSFSRVLLKDRWNIIEYPEHLCYFTPKTLRRLFLQSGFKLQRLETTGLSLTRLKAGVGIQGQKVVTANSDDERLRQALESHSVLRHVKGIANQLLSLFQRGDTIKATFLKPSSPDTSPPRSVLPMS